MKISVVTVCFNAIGTIGDTLASVAAQDHPDVEHIVVDGGSRDGTVEKVRAEGTRVARLVSERDKGVYDAMNKGIGLATGEVVGFLNADDALASPQVLSRVAATLGRRDVDGCFGDLCYVRQDDPAHVVRYWRSSPFAPGAFRRGWVPPHPTFYARREVYARLGGFDLSYRIAADADLLIRFFEVARLRTAYVPELMVRMRLGGVSNRSFRNVWLQNREIFRSLSDHGLKPSLAQFALGKLASRSRQFVAGRAVMAGAGGGTVGT